GTRCRLPYGIFRIQVRAVLPGRVPRHVFDLRPGHDSLSRRVVGARLVPPRFTFVVLVLLEGYSMHFRFYLDARDAATPAPGPVDEFRLEVRSTVHASRSDGHGALAVYGRWLAALDRLHVHSWRCLRPDGPPALAAEADWP